MAFSNSTAQSTPMPSVLANAYAGLALLMLPTAAGSYLTGSALREPIAAHPLAFLIVSIASAFGLLFAIFANRDSASGFGFAAAFALAMGGIMGPGLDHTINAHANGATLVALAAIATAGLFIGLAAYVHATGRDFQGLGGILYAGLWGLIAAGVANMFIGSTLVESLSAGAGVAIFSGYILYDVSEAVHGRQDNWILLSVSLYLDVLNLFLDILRLLTMFSGSDD